MMDMALIDGFQQSLDEMINLAEQFYKNELASLAHTRNADYLQSVLFEIEQAKLFRKKIAELEKPAEEDLNISVEQVNSALRIANETETEKDKELFFRDPVVYRLSHIFQQYAESYHAKKCAECKGGGEWVSVEDRLPEDDGDAWLICDTVGNVFRAWYWLNTGWNDEEGHIAVTHWQPLPEAPNA